MFKNTISHALIFALIFAYILLSFVFNDWFAMKMARHQIILLPSVFLIGVAIALSLSRFIIRDLSIGISVLIFISASIIFWMLPHSVDKTVLYPLFDKLMHLNMFVSGFLLIGAFRGLLFEIRIFFLGMLSAKLIAAGIVLKVFNILLCSSFDLLQQKETGNYLIVLGATLVFFTLLSFFRKAQIEAPV